jgi:outer membrane protein assembly factor BamB
LFSLLALLSFTTQVSAQDWTRFRGPNGSGLSDAKTVPVAWETDEVNWAIELAGSGNSSPVAWGTKLFVTGADDSGKRMLQCFDTHEGQELWQRAFEFTTYKKHKNNSYASSTPCVDADHVYILWQARDSSPLIAMDHNGNEVWRFELGPYLHGQGGGTSPIVHEDLVIVCNDHQAGSFLVAVDRKSGKERWRVPRQGKRACYATPCIFDPGDRPQEIVFSHCFEGIVGIDAESGKQNWMIDVFGTFPQRAVGSPIVAEGLIIANSGALAGEKNVVAVRPTLKGTEIVAEEVYRVTKNAPHVPTTIAFDHWLFLWSDNGIVTCLNVATGEKLWQERVNGDFFSSPICIDGKLYCVDVDGTVVVVAAADQFRLLGRSKLGGTCRSTPAVHQGALFVRTDNRLHSIGGKK